MESLLHCEVLHTPSSQLILLLLRAPGWSSMSVYMCVVCVRPASTMTYRNAATTARLMTGRDVCRSTVAWDSARKSNNQCSIVCLVFPHSFNLASALVSTWSLRCCRSCRQYKQSVSYPSYTKSQHINHSSGQWRLLTDKGRILLIFLVTLLHK